jgi:DNA polymerase-4
VTAAKLEKLGIATCADLRQWSLLDLHRRFGVFGKRLYELARGIDHRAVQADQERKSISVETTYVTDLLALDECTAEIKRLAEQLDARIERAGAMGAIPKLFVKIRFADFQRTTVECIADATDLPTVLSLLEKGFARHNRPVRLLGVGVRLEQDDETKSGQIPLFPDQPSQTGEDGSRA